MRKFYSRLLTAAVAFGMLSCTPDSDFVLSNGNMGSFGFSIGTAAFNDGFDSRSQSQVIDTFVVGDDTLELVCTVSDLDAPRPEEEMATRGTPIYGSATPLKTTYGHFSASAFIVGDDGTLTDFQENSTTSTGTSTFVNVDYEYNASQDGLEYWAAGSAANNFFWWQEYPLCFYAYAPTSNVTAYPFSLTKDNFKKDGKIEFTYTVPVSTSSPRTDAEKQPDILLTSTGKTPLKRDDLGTATFSGDVFSLVPLTFHHALSGVRFKADPSLAATESGLIINSITLSGLKSTATCTFDPAATGDKITWSNYGTDNDGTYTQAFSYTVPTTSNLQNGATQKDATIYGAENGTGANKNFMLIPQTYGPATGSNASAATVEINYTFRGVTKTKSTLLANGTTNVTWKPGKLYTYAIRKVVSSIDVSLVETFNASSKIKTNVNAKNTGTVNAYVRAAVVANWVNEAGFVIAPLTLTDTDQCDFSGFGSTWIKGTDGFYYYPNIIKPDKEPATKLFTKLEAKTSPADPSDAHLEVTVIVQALSAKETDARATAASTWGGISASDLTTSVEE